MTAYRELASRGISTRVAADLVGIPRATATRKPRVSVSGPAPTPANKIGQSDRRQILDIVNSESFVDLPPIQIYAQLLDAGTYLGAAHHFSNSCSVSIAIRSESYRPRSTGLEKVVPGSSWTCCIAVPITRSTIPP